MPAQKDLNLLFNPKSVAVVGASKDLKKLGAIVLKSIVDSRFPGEIYPVNPNYSKLGKLRCYKNVADIPQTPDLVILAVPAEAVIGVLKESGQKGIKNALVFAAGYKEAGEDGEKMEKELIDTANQNGINLLGPNCLGFVNNTLPINATFSQSTEKTGNLSFITQSGAIAASVFDWCQSIDLGFNEFVTLGNKSVLNENDILEYFQQKPGNTIEYEKGLSHVSPIGLYLESISNGEQFLKIAREISKKDPILLLKPGRTPAATKAMHSHTGAIAQEDDILQALVEQAGITRCQTLQEFFDFSRAFSWEDLPSGPNVAIISNAGGPAVVSSDAVVLEGLSLAEINDETKKQLLEVLPRSANILNPIDVLGDALAERYAKALEILLQQDNVNSLVVILTPQIMTQIEETAKIIGEASKKYKKPIFCSFMGGLLVSEGEKVLNKYKIPSFRFPEGAISAVSAMWKYKMIRDKLNEPEKAPAVALIETETQDRGEEVRGIIQKAVNNGDKALDNISANSVIASVGIPTPPTQTVATLAEAEEFAKKNGWPVVLKLSSPKLLHKREVGGIILNISNEEALDNAWHQLERKIEQLDKSLKESLTLQIQKDVSNGVEVIVGLKQDPTFGSVLLFGAGGMFAELIGDKNLHLLPINLEEAKELVQRSKVYKVLQGKSGEPPYALEKLYQLIVNMGRLASAVPEAREIEINPVIININDVWAVDSKVVLREGQTKTAAQIQFKLAGTLKNQVLASKFHYYDFESEKPLIFKPGQYISVKVAPNTLRAYSIATHSDERHFNLLVDIRPGGPGSQFFENLKVGNVMTYMGPFGVFTFNPSDGSQNILFLATGSGISAVRCMIDAALLEQKITQPIYLYFGLTHEGEIFWQDHFEELAKKYPNFKYRIALCKPTGDWKGHTGFITQLVEKDFPNASTCSAYLCGHRNMIADATQLLEKNGCLKERIYTERFV